MIEVNYLDELTGEQVYEIFLLRQQVFMLEQGCLYQDIDRADTTALHMRYLDESGQLLGYLRIITPSENTELAIARVAVRKKFRRQGIAQKMMQMAIDECQNRYPGQKIRIAAQAYLIDFYSGLGFSTAGLEYIEDDIPHQDMVLKY